MQGVVAYWNKDSEAEAFMGTIADVGKPELYFKNCFRLRKDKSEKGVENSRKAESWGGEAGATLL